MLPRWDSSDVGEVRAAMANATRQHALLIDSVSSLLGNAPGYAALRATTGACALVGVSLLLFLRRVVQRRSTSTEKSRPFRPRFSCSGFVSWCFGLSWCGLLYAQLFFAGSQVFTLDEFYRLPIVGPGVPSIVQTRHGRKTPQDPALVDINVEERLQLILSMANRTLYTIDKLTESRVKPFLDSGTLIGYVRMRETRLGGRLLPWDDDFDIAFRSKILLFSSQIVMCTTPSEPL